MNLVPLFEEALEFQDYNGTVLSDGKVAVYYIGRTRLADIYEDVAAEYPAENPRILNNLGMGPVYVNPAFDYEMVVFDAYGSELFSVKKYLASKGEHSTANVVVTPSESIAVSAWTVGDVQVYMPYLTGQLGKIYTGIEPIVVNNIEDKISAQHVPLGVQDPLYFVQDDEEGCIIGCSAQTEIPVELSGKWDEASDAVIANSAQWSEGTTYEAGSYIDIDNNTISVTGLSPLPADTASTGLVAQVSADITAMIPDTSDMATQTWVNEQGFLTAVDLTPYQTTADMSGYLKTGDSANFYTTANESGFINSAAISAMATTGFVADVSADITAMIPTALTGDYLTKESADTLYQPIGNYQSALTFNYTNDDEISGINGSAIYGQGGGVTGDYELSAGSGISIVDYPLEQKTVISVTAQGGNPEVEQAVIDNSATWNEVTAKADSTAIPSLDGYATEDWVTGQGYLTAETDWTNTITAASANAYAEATAAIPTGLATEDWVTAQGYLTGVDLTPYQTTADMVNYQPVSSMTAYQSAGDYATTAQLADKLDSSAIGIKTGPVDLVSSINGLKISAWTADDASYASRASLAYADNQGNYFSSTYIKNTDLATADGKVTAISGIPLSAGGDVPEGVMVESGIEYNSQGYINGYSGSAIATIDQERQWFTHDDTLCHVSNSAQYALGVNMSAISADLARMMGVDETVLLDKTWDDTLWNEPLAEPISAFKTVRFVLTRNDGANELKFQDYYTTGLSGKDFLLQNTVYMGSIYTYFTIAKFNGNNYQEISAHIGQEGTTGYSWQNVNCWCHPVKIIGIGRKS